MQVPQGKNNVYEPVIVGIPPSNPFRNLVRLPDGTMRCYGYSSDKSQYLQPVYLQSCDNGLSWNEIVQNDEMSSIYHINVEAMAPAYSPYSGDYYFFSSGNEPGHDKVLYRSSNGIDGPYKQYNVTQYWGGIESESERMPIFLRKRKRVIMTTQVAKSYNKGFRYHPAVALSDDDGYSWRLSVLDTIGPHPVQWPHKGLRWQNYALEPTVVELSDGRLWMLARTSTDFHYEAYSEDGGDTWSKLQPSRFYGTLTMPTLQRLSDGRILLLWCNTTPLAERDHNRLLDDRHALRDVPWTKDINKWVKGVRAGEFEDVFTNRDAVHAAISEDDGKTWIGFREFYLNPLRNDQDFATSKGGISEDGVLYSNDKSCHQSQAVELPNGKILVATGQHVGCARLIVFDLQWLYEKGRFDDFSQGLDDWSTHQYIDQIRGHCAYDRILGAGLVPHPDYEDRRVLHVKHLQDSELVSDVEGAVWNFPAGYSGQLSVWIKLVQGSKGGRISLMDRWINPTDDLIQHYSMFTMLFGCSNEKDAIHLTENAWHKISFSWNISCEKCCVVDVDGEVVATLPQVHHCAFGISYVHFQSVTDEYDEKGFLIEKVDVKIL